MIAASRAAFHPVRHRGQTSPAVMPTSHLAAAASRTAPGTAIAIFNREPFSIALAVDIVRIAIIVQMAQFVDEDVVKIKILDGWLRPGKPPHAGRWLVPAATIHSRLIDHIHAGRLVKILFQRLLQRIKIEGGPPLHAITGKAFFLACHPAKLHHLQRAKKVGGDT